MIRLHGSAETTERRIVMIRRERVEIVRQLRVGRRNVEVPIRRLIERAARGRRRSERIVCERIAERALSRPCPAAGAKTAAASGAEAAARALTHSLGWLF